MLTDTIDQTKEERTSLSALRDLQRKTSVEICKRILSEETKEYTGNISINLSFQASSPLELEDVRDQIIKGFSKHLHNERIQMDLGTSMNLRRCLISEVKILEKKNGRT